MIISVIDTETVQPVGATGPDGEQDAAYDLAVVTCEVTSDGVTIIRCESVPLQPDPRQMWTQADWLPARAPDMSRRQEARQLLASPVALAHNARYDQRVTERGHHLLTPTPERWLCTYRQIRWQTRRGVILPPVSQTELCARLGVACQHAHTAIGDALALVACLQTQPDPLAELQTALRRRQYVTRIDIDRDDAARAGVHKDFDIGRPSIWLAPEELAAFAEVPLVEYVDPKPVNLRADIAYKDDLKAIGCQWDPVAKTWWTTLCPGDRAAIPSWATATVRPT